MSDNDAHGAKMLSVRIHEQDFALDIGAVREIRGWTPATPLPHAPPYVLGMVNLRGAVVAILDLGARLGLAASEPGPSSVVVVVEVEGRTVGLLVDAVSDIVTVPADMIQAAPDVGTEAIQDVLRGITDIDGRLVSILAIAAVLPHGAVLAA